MVVFDTTFLRLLLRPNADPPLAPDTGEPVSRCQERIEYLVERLEADSETIVIPTPALAELLVIENEDGPKHLSSIDRYGVFNIVDFDRRAAIEVAEMTRRELNDSGANVGGEPKTKVKYDRQILAMAKVTKSHTIYSDDSNLRKKARKIGLTAIGVHELPSKPNAPQQELDLDATESGE